MWHEDSLSSGVVDILRNSKADTRDFLRPIFKWMKNGSKHFNPTKAFEYVQWMILVKEKGDSSLGVSRQPHIQPKYAYNTIITMCQRNNDHCIALKAYDCMVSDGYEPDVFTLTALLDVVGRNGNFNLAFDMYKDMIHGGKNLPNVVTFVTLIRVVSNLDDKDVAVEKVYVLLNDAHSLVSAHNGAQIGDADGKVVISIYNAALSAFVRLGNLKGLLHVLRDMQSEKIEWTSLTLDIVSKYYYRHRSEYSEVGEYVDLLTDVKAIDTERLSGLSEYIKRYVDIKDANLSEKKLYAGCLGPDAPESLRASVILHDIGKLLDRLEPEDCSQLTENDFVTLLHQCRKRKWSDQICFIVSRMVEVSQVGLPELDVPPVIHLTPTQFTYEAALDGFFHSHCSQKAWDLLCVAVESDVDFDSPFLHFIAGGFLHCGDSERATSAYLLLRSKGIIPQWDTVIGLMRGLGGDLANAEKILNDIVGCMDTITTGSVCVESRSKTLVDLVLPLMESCAILGRPEGIEMLVLLLSQSQHEVLRSAVALTVQADRLDFVMICFSAACSLQNIPAAFDFIAEWQLHGYLPPFAFIYSITLELLACFVDGTSQMAVSSAMTSLPYRGFLRTGAVKLCETKRQLVEYLLTTAQFSGLRNDVCEPLGLGPYLNDLRGVFSTYEPNSHSGRVIESTCEECCDQILDQYVTQFRVCNNRTLLMTVYLQHVWALMICIRSKEEKMRVHDAVARSVFKLPSEEERGEFLCAALRSLDLLVLSTKQQGKLLGTILQSLSKTVPGHSPSPVLTYSLLRTLMTSVECSLPCLEALKEVYKYTLRCCGNAAAEEDFKTELSRTLVLYLEKNKATPVKIVQIVKQFDIHSALDVSRLEELLVRHCVQDIELNWMALTTYIGDRCSKVEACRRICRLLINQHAESIATKVLCRFQVFEDEFGSLLQPSEKLFAVPSDKKLDAEFGADGDNLLPLLTIDEYGVEVVIVNDMETLMHAARALEKDTQTCDDGRVIALDVEWRPFGHGHANKCSLLQVASPKVVFIFDLMVLEPAWTSTNSCGSCDDTDSGSLFGESKRTDIQHSYAGLMSRLLSDRNILKLGYKLSGDVNRLRESFPDSHHYQCIEGVHEISSYSTCGAGLATLCKEVLGYRLDKSMQTSDWQLRPLCSEQIAYAALDAFVLIELYKKLRKSNNTL